MASRGFPSFLKLKEAMIITLVLALLNFHEIFVVETNALIEGIGAVLMQRGHPIAYISKALSPKNKVFINF